MNTTQLPYVDGFVLVIPKKNLESYRRMAELSAEVWKDHGALDYKECLLEDDAPCGNIRSFTNLAGAKEDETVVFAYIVYPSREVRDEVNAKVMADPRMQSVCPETNPNTESPFDPSRMAYAGFQTFVSA